MKTKIETAVHAPWNKSKLTGQKAPLRLHETYAIRVRDLAFLEKPANTTNTLTPESHAHRCTTQPQPSPNPPCQPANT